METKLTPNEVRDILDFMSMGLLKTGTDLGGVLRVHLGITVNVPTSLGRAHAFDVGYLVRLLDGMNASGLVTEVLRPLAILQQGTASQDRRMWAEHLVHGVVSQVLPLVLVRYGFESLAKDCASPGDLPEIKNLLQNVCDSAHAVGPKTGDAISEFAARANLRTIVVAAKIACHYALEGRSSPSNEDHVRNTVSNIGYCVRMAVIDAPDTSSKMEVACAAILAAENAYTLTPNEG